MGDDTLADLLPPHLRAVDEQPKQGMSHMASNAGAGAMITPRPRGISAVRSAGSWHANGGPRVSPVYNTDTVHWACSRPRAEAALDMYRDFSLLLERKVLSDCGAVLVHHQCLHLAKLHCE